MLLLFKANVPNGKIFAAKTDRDLAILATEAGINLPLHLQHLPSLPLPRSASEVKAMEDAVKAAEQAVEQTESTEMKDRPPRRHLAGKDVKHLPNVGIGAPVTPESSPPPSTRQHGSSSPPPSTRQHGGAAGQTTDRRGKKKKQKGSKASSIPTIPEASWQDRVHPGRLMRRLSREFSGGMAVLAETSFRPKTNMNVPLKP